MKLLRKIFNEVRKIPQGVVWVWRWSGMRQTSLRVTLGVYGLVAIFMVVYIDNEAEDSHRAMVTTEFNFALANYQSELAVYQNARDVRDTCLSSAVSRLNNIENWYALYDAFETYVGEDAAPIINDLRRDFDERTPPLNAEDCPPVPETPTPPRLDDS